MEEQKKIESLNAHADMGKIVPKFCTAININLLNNKNLVLTMVYNENKEGAVIERIVIDMEHAKSLNDILTKLLNDTENDSTKSK